MQTAAPARGSRGKTRDGASFPVPPPRAELPGDYAETLAEIKQRIQQERLRVVLTANSAMVLLYWDIGRMILDRQQREGWGARVIDRLAADLREDFSNMKGLSPRNLKYMRAFAAAWPNRTIVQEALAQITWYLAGSSSGSTTSRAPGEDRRHWPWISWMMIIRRIRPGGI